MVERPVTVAVRYCGGCNPRYDRVAFVKELANACPYANFINAGTDVADAHLSLVICGCSARCAEVSDLPDCLGPWIVSSAEEWQSVKASLDRISGII